MRILKVSVLNHLILKTDKGDLTLQIRKGEETYQFVLDSVPVSEEKQKELETFYKGILF